MKTFEVTVATPLVRIEYLATAASSFDAVEAAMDKYGPTARITVKPI